MNPHSSTLPSLASGRAPLPLRQLLAAYLAEFRQDLLGALRSVGFALPTLLVPLAEEGRVHRGDPVTERVVEEYLASIRAEGVDTLVLGCTHYPLLRDVIADFMGRDVTLIDTGEQAARSAAALLREKDGLNGPDREGERRYYASDSAEDFAAMASMFLGSDITECVERVAIENY